MTLQSSFKEGDRVQIVLPELSLEAGAGKEYPNLGTGIVIPPATKIEKFKYGHLEDERLVFILLDKPFIRKREKDDMSIWRKDKKIQKKEMVIKLTVPEWLLKPLEEN